MALEIHHSVKLGESQEESDRSLCASASFSQVIGEALHTHKNCSKLLLKDKSDKHQQRERQKFEAQRQKCEAGEGNELF